MYVERQLTEAVDGEVRGHQAANATPRCLLTPSTAGRPEPQTKRVRTGVSERHAGFKASPDANTVDSQRE